MAEIDRYSFIYGMIAAFGECVAQEVKKVAFSPPFPPSDLKLLEEEAERIMREQGLSYCLEENPDIPEDERVYWWVLYKFPEVRDVYKRQRLECGRTSTAMRIVDLLSPIGKGQRGMIVSPPKAGKTTLLKQVALSVRQNNPEIHLLILLIDERPEEVTDIKEAIEGENVEVIYSTFDELPEHHKRVSEMVIERAKRLVEHKKDVMILLDSITRLARAYNLTVPSSGRTLSGGCLLYTSCHVILFL